MLEPRQLLSTITWNTTLNPTGGNWDLAGNWSPAQVPGAGDDAVIDLPSVGSVSLSSNQADAVHSLTTNASTTLKVQNGSLLLGAGSSTLDGPVNVAAGATLGVGAGASVLIGAGQTITDNGTMTVGNGAQVGMATLNQGPTTIAVNGIFNASGATFYYTSSPDGAGSALIQVNSGGVITPTDSAFKLSIAVPYNNVPSLAAGMNVSFDQIEINSGTLSSGALDLEQIGTNTANLSYVFPSGFTIMPLTSLTIGSDVSVLIDGSQTITDNGTMTVGNGSQVELATLNQGTSAITVNGILNATGATFYYTSSPDGAGSAQIQVNSGGVITPTDSAFKLPIAVPYSDVPSLAAGMNVSFDQIEINSGTLSSGTLDLEQIGTNTANLSYAFPSGFTIMPLTSLTIGSDVSVLIGAGQTITDNGTMTVGNGSQVGMATQNQGTTTIAVNGIFNASGATFYYTNSPDGAGNALIQVNSGGVITPTGSAFKLPIAVPYNDVLSLAVGMNVSFDQIEINSGTLSSGTLDLEQIGTNTANLSYAFPSGFTIMPLTSLTIGSEVSVLIGGGQTITDNGTMTLGSGSQVGMATLNQGTSAIVVNGILNASGATFYYTTSPDGQGSAQIQVNSGGVITPTGSTFKLPIAVPYSDVPSLAASMNVSFDQIEINSGTLSSGTLDLEQIGTNTANLSYAFPGGFSIMPLTSLTIGTDVNVLVGAGETFTDNGTITAANGSQVGMATLNQGTTTIAVSGMLTASGTNFYYTHSPDGAGSALIQVNSGGTIDASDSDFGVPQLALSAGSNDTLHFTTFTGQLAINSGANINVSGNDFSKVGDNGIIATGVSTAQIPLEENYWATTDPTAIGELILDHVDDPTTRPTVDFQPAWSSNIGTIAAPAFATFSPSDQTVNLSATVSTTGGIPISGGTENFTIMNGTQVIGQTTAAASVVNGSVTAPFTLPGGTPLGQYEIVASYSGTSNYPASTDTSQILLVYPGPSHAVGNAHSAVCKCNRGAGVLLRSRSFMKRTRRATLRRRDNTTIVTASLNTGAGPLQGTLTATVVGGIATFSNLFDQLAETISINFMSGTLTEATSNIIVVSPAAATKLGDRPTAAGDRDGGPAFLDPTGRHGGGPVRKRHHGR